MRPLMYVFIVYYILHITFAFNLLNSLRRAFGIENESSNDQYNFLIRSKSEQNPLF